MEAYRRMADEIVDELPEELLDELNLGIVILDRIKVHPKSIGDELLIMGEYQVSPMGSGILLYFRSFRQIYGGLPEEEQKAELRRIIRHELRHHWEYLSGDDTLGDEDRRQLEAYLEENE